MTKIIFFGKYHHRGMFHYADPHQPLVGAKTLCGIDLAESGMDPYQNVKLSCGNCIRLLVGAGAQAIAKRNRKEMLA